MKYLALTLPGGVEIVPPANVPSGGFGDGSGTGNQILGNALQVSFFIAIILALFFIVFAGVQWIGSRGDKQKLEAARNRLIYSIIGLVVVFLSVTIINLFLFFFGAEVYQGE